MNQIYEELSYRGYMEKNKMHVDRKSLFLIGSLENKQFISFKTNRNQINQK